MRRLNVLFLLIVFVGCDEEQAFRYEPCIEGIQTIEYKQYLQGDKSQGFVTQRVDCDYDDKERPIAIFFQDFLQGDATRNHLVMTKLLDYSEDRVIITTLDFLQGSTEGGFITSTEIINF